MTNNTDNKITLSERLITFIVSAIAMFITLAVLFCLAHLFLDRYGRLPILSAIIKEWFWIAVAVISLCAGILGFVLGSDKMADAFGFIWRTNNKWQ